MSTQFIILLLAAAAVIVLFVILLMKISGLQGHIEIEDMSDTLESIEDQMSADRQSAAEHNAQLRNSVENSLRSGMKMQFQTLEEMSDKLMDRLREMTETQERSLRYMMKENSEHLEKLQGVVSDKLDRTLNERLDSNFRQVGEQLGSLYQSLGELRELSSGVQDLNRTLTNVKTRGTWGEVQLGRILEQTIPRGQYEQNVATKKDSSDRVEYAVKLPGPADDETVYLPIDAKFPSDIYNAIVDASSAGDTEGLARATADLRRRILEEARTIRDKYIDPPRTTNYAIMFLPTEGLYAEVLRINGLTEQCQQMGVVVTGPTTVTAVLNSLQAGFRTVQLSKKSVEVMRLLEAVKAQFARMDDEVKKTQKKLSEAAQATDQLQHRTGIIRSRMRKIGELEIGESDSLLGLTKEEISGEETLGI